MKLYVLNATGQHSVFHYRVDYLVDNEGRAMVGTAKPFRKLDIPARTQIQLGGDWNAVEMGNIVEQLEEAAVGGVHVNDIRTAKANGLVRLVWSQDRSIPRAICDDVYAHNVSFLTNDGERRRKQMALANAVTNDAANSEEASAFSVEVETVSEAEDSASPSIEAGYRVEKSGKATQPAKKATGGGWGS